MLPRVLLMAGWILPFAVLLLFVVKGQFYNPAVFTPPASEVTALPVPVSLGNWVLESGVVLPADRMFEKINGKADYYLQYGAVELSSGEWLAGGQRWDMYLYRFETEQGARGAYNGEKPSSDGRPIEGVEGYALPGQAAMTAGTYYLQLNAFSAGADPEPAEELCMALKSHLESGEGETQANQTDLVALAGAAIIGEAEGFVPESAFGFSAFNNVRTVDVSLNDSAAVWFNTAGDAATVAGYAEELALYGGEGLFTQNDASGGCIFGSWSIAGVLNGQLWGVQNASSREALMRHWNALQERVSKAKEEP